MVSSEGGLAPGLDPEPGARGEGYRLGQAYNGKGVESMKRSCENIYKNARNFAGLTIERAAELIGVALRTLSGYEKGEYIPPADIVCIMCEVYRADWLAYQHLQSSNPLGQKYLPEIDFSNLPQRSSDFKRRWLTRVK
jgi:transcriptional regulator with XRE-family HTH domain